MPFSILNNLPPLALPEGVAGLLRDLIHERTGIFFETSRFDIMLDKLSPQARERGCHSFLDYYYILKYQDQNNVEWDKVMDVLSVQETFFWRETDQINALMDLILPGILKTSTMPLRIWSAACATGEEPYSIVMALEEAGLQHKNIEVIASDASKTALDKAKRGLYRERSFRNLPEHLRARYFVKEGDEWRILPRIVSKVSYRNVNLVNRDEIASQQRADIIFCRNVFIYFSSNSIKRTIQSFAQLLPHDGWLFVGSSESLLKLTTDYTLQHIGNAFGYQRNGSQGGAKV